MTDNNNNNNNNNNNLLPVEDPPSCEPATAPADDDADGRRQLTPPPPQPVITSKTTTMTIADSIHPPTFVTLSPGTRDMSSPLPDSPLSSQGNSPILSHRPIGDEHDDDDDDDVNNNKNNNNNSNTLGLVVVPTNVTTTTTTTTLSSPPPLPPQPPLHHTETPFDEPSRRKEGLLLSLQQQHSGGHHSSTTEDGDDDKGQNNHNNNDCIEKDIKSEKRNLRPGSSTSEGETDVPDDEKKVDDTATTRSSNNALYYRTNFQHRTISEEEEEEITDDEEEEVQNIPYVRSPNNIRISSTFDSHHRTVVPPSNSSSSWTSPTDDVVDQHEDDIHEPPSLSSSRQQQQQRGQWRPTSTYNRDELGGLNSMASLDHRRWYPLTTGVAASSNNNSNINTTSSSSSLTPTSSEEPPSLSLIEEVKQRYLNRPELTKMLGDQQAGTTTTTRSTIDEVIGRLDVNPSNRRYNDTKSWMDLIKMGSNDVTTTTTTKTTATGDDNDAGAAAAGAAAAGASGAFAVSRNNNNNNNHTRGKSFGDVTKLRTLYQHHHKSGARSCSTLPTKVDRPTTGGIEREQHLRFAALKREIVLTAKRGLDDFDATLTTDTTRTTTTAVAAAAAVGVTTTTTAAAVAPIRSDPTTVNWQEKNTFEEENNVDGSMMEESLESSKLSPGRYKPPTKSTQNKDPLQGDIRIKQVSPTTKPSPPYSSDDSEYPSFYEGTPDSRADSKSTPSNTTNTEPVSDSGGAAPTAAATVGAEMPSSSIRAKSEGQPAIISPDGDMEVMEMSVMVSPDGEIDYSKPIINLSSSPSRSEAGRTGTVDDDTEVSGGREKNDSLVVPDLDSRQHLHTVPVDEDPEWVNSSRNVSMPSVARTIDDVASSAIVEHNVEQEYPSLGPTQSQGSLEGCGSDHVTSSSNSGTRCTPPDRPWEDYLTSRGVAASTSPLRKESPLSELVTRTIEQSAIENIGKALSTEERTGDGQICTEILTGEVGDKNSVQNKPHHAPYRDLTPKKDLQGSEKGSVWLQEELRRRAHVKKEINDAILAAGRETRPESVSPTYGNLADPVGCTMSTFFEGDNEDSNSVLDDELAAINADEGSRDRDASRDSFDQPSTDGRVPGNDGMEDTNPRVLDFFDGDEANAFEETDTSGELVVSESVMDHRNEMRKFASETRAALRDRSLTEIAAPLAISLTMKDEDESIDHPPEQVPISKSWSWSKGQHSESTGTEFADLLSNDPPVMIGSMDCFEGIAKGDITLSLLSENTGSMEMSVAATWANRVHGAIWRSRRMRRNMMHIQEIHHRRPSGSPARGLSSLPVDLDNARAAGEIRTVESTQAAALRHLEHDELEEAIELYEDIIFAYYSYFERSLSMRENMNVQSGIGRIDFKPYIGMAMHNLGVLYLLKGDYQDALTFFTRAAESRKSYLGEGHPDHVSSLVKVAICRYALNEFAEAHARLEEALFYAKKSCISLEGRVQMAEILNNLGCLAYMCGQPAAAISFFRDSMDVQFGALSVSLYGGNATLGQSISLNISITRANIGLVKLVTKDLPVAITALENALMEQQILLRGAHETIVATMDHLAVSNLLYGDLEKAALMFNRILEIQQNEYGPLDRRCFVTAEKISMVQNKGIQYENAIEELHKTFSLPEPSVPKNHPPFQSNSNSGSKQGGKVSRGRKGSKGRQVVDAAHTQQAKGQKKISRTNKLLKVLSSMRKKKL